MRKNNTRRRRLDAISHQSRYLTPGELVYARLDLAADMVELVLGEDNGPALPPPLHQALQGLVIDLDAVLEQARELP
jgi:hypothetical protein